MSGNEWFLSLIERTYSKINIFTMQYFAYEWRNKFKILVPNLITVAFLLFIKSQFTTNAQNVLHVAQRTHGHVCPRTVAPFQRSRV